MECGWVSSVVRRSPFDSANDSDGGFGHLRSSSVEFAQVLDFIGNRMPLNAVLKLEKSTGSQYYLS